MRITDSRRSTASAIDQLPMPHAARDGFANFVAKYGHGAQNQGSHGTYVLAEKLSQFRIRLDAMYRQSWVCGKVVDVYGNHMTRAGIDISGSSTPDDVKKLQKALTKTGVWAALNETIKWGRLYGGAIAFIDIDGQDPATPLQLDTVTRGAFNGMRVFDRHQLSPDLNVLVPSGPKAGLPAYYRVVADPSLAMPSGLTIHHSRCVRYQGIQLPRWQAVGEHLWGESVLERMFDRLLAFDHASAGAANLVHRAYLRVARVKDFRKALVAGGEAENDVLKFFKLVAYLQGTEGMTVVDSEDEFQTMTYTFTGLDEILLSFGQQLSGASDIPLVVMFGQSPKGLNATGESDTRMYYDGINAEQESKLRDPMETVLEIVHRSEFGVAPPDDFDFDFNPLWQLSLPEKAKVAVDVATAVNACVAAGTLTPALGMKELQQISDETGIFTNITDEDIAAAEMLAPLSGVPLGQDPLATIQAFVNGTGAGGPLAKIQAFVAGGGQPVDPASKIRDFVDPSSKIRRFVGGGGSSEERIRAFAEAA